MANLTFGLIALFGFVFAVDAFNITNTQKAYNVTYPIHIPENVIVKRTNDSMCIKTLDPINGTNVSNIDSTDPPPPCNWNCRTCMDTCTAHGFGYSCCYNQWCCCYTTGGPCARTGVNCWSNGCPP